MKSCLSIEIANNGMAIIMAIKHVYVYTYPARCAGEHRRGAGFCCYTTSAFCYRSARGCWQRDATACCTAAAAVARFCYLLAHHAISRRWRALGGGVSRRAYVARAAVPRAVCDNARRTAAAVVARVTSAYGRTKTAIRRNERRQDGRPLPLLS